MSPNLHAVCVWGLVGMTLMVCSIKPGYPPLSDGKTVLQGEPGAWDENAVHTLSIVQAGRDGFKYWGYYGLDYYAGPPEKRKAGLVRSNDLVHWEKFSGNPLVGITNCRWPFVILADGMFYLFYEEYNANMESRILRLSGADGMHFGQPEEVVPLETGLQNQNPFVYQNPADGQFYLFYYHGRERGPGDHHWDIYMRKATDPAKFNLSEDHVILSSPDITASPSIVYCHKKYWLTVESFRPGRFDDKWVTRLYESPSISGPFTEAPESPVLRQNDACAFQTMIDGRLVVFYSERYDAEKNRWDVRMAEEK